MSRSQVSLEIDGDVVVKVRPLRPVEQIETPIVLRHLMELEVPGLCPVLGFEVDRTGLLSVRLPFVRGTDLRHQHDEQGRNTEPSVAMLRRVRTDQRLVHCAQVVDVIASLHTHGIIYGDLKVEQLIVSECGGVVLLDVDEVTVEGSASAQRPVVGSPLDPFLGLPSTRRTDQWRLGRLIHELYVGQHLCPSFGSARSEPEGEVATLVWSLLSPDLVDLRQVASALRSLGTSDAPAREDVR